MKYLLSLFFLISLQMFSQTLSIEITNQKGKTIIIEQDKRIKIITEDGKRYFGRVNIISNENVVMGKDTLDFASIVTIQKRSSLKSALSAVLIAGSSLLLPSSFAFIFVNTNTAGAMFATGLVGLPTGILLPVLGKNYHRKSWNFEVINP